MHNKCMGLYGNFSNYRKWCSFLWPNPDLERSLHSLGTSSTFFLLMKSKAYHLALLDHSLEEASIHVCLFIEALLSWKCTSKKMEIISEGERGFTIMEFWGHGRANTFWNFRRQGGLKHESRPWLGMHIFWNCPFHIWIYMDKIIWECALYVGQHEVLAKLLYISFVCIFRCYDWLRINSRGMQCRRLSVWSVYFNFKGT